MEIRTHAREKRQADTKDLTSSSKIIRVLSSNLTDAPWVTNSRPAISLMFLLVFMRPSSGFSYVLYGDSFKEPINGIACLALVLDEHIYNINLRNSIQK